MAALNRALSSFKCSKDYDIESFIRNNAIKYSDRNICYSYLIVNKSAFDNDLSIDILAYFTLSFKTVFLDKEQVKNSDRNRITNGFSSRSSEPVVLIGQLGKNEGAAINLSMILNYALDIIYGAVEYIPCNSVLVECSTALHEKGLYSNQGFRYLTKEGDLHQYYLPL